jgi:RNA polymerase sigma-70 factor (ECF subfamily)
MAEQPQNVARWLPAARAGCRDALGQLFESYRAYLLLIANHQLAPDLQAKGGASDLVQQTFLEAQKDFGRFQGESADELKAWLRQLLLHNLASFARHYRTTSKRAVGREVGLGVESPSGEHERALPAALPSPSGQAIAGEQAEAVARAMQRLPADYQRVITLRYQEGRPFAEIAQLMQRSDAAVRKLWFRAIDRLLHELEAPRER